MKKDLQEVIRYLESTSYHLNAYLGFSLDLLANYHRLLEEAIAIKWLSEECGRLSERLKRRWGD